MERNNSESSVKVMETKNEKTTKSKINSKHVFQGASVKTRNPQSCRPTYLLYGSFYPKPRTKENWKQKCEALEKENKLLREENMQQKEEIQVYKYEQQRLLERYHDFVDRLVHLRSGENVQIGDHNSQVVHNYYDISVVKDLTKIEDNLKDDAKKEKLMEELILDLKSQFENNAELHDKDARTDTQSCKYRRFSNDMRQLSEHLKNTEMACPDSKESRETPDLRRHLRELCSSRKYDQSTFSLDERNFENNDNKCECRRKIRSEHNLNLEE